MSCRTCIKVDSLKKSGCNCEKCKGKTFKSLEEWLNYSTLHVYIGRNMSFYVKGAEKSKWHNPYTIKKYGREEALKKYKKYVKNNDELDVSELNGCVLGCWCKPEEGCHADVLLKLVNK